MPDSQRPSASNTQATLLALVALLLIDGGLLALTAVVLPALLGLFGVGFAFFCLASFHYVVWGWWFRGTPQPQEPSDE